MAFEQLRSVNDVFTALGGNPGIETLTGCKSSTVSMWKSAERFPSNTYVLITDALRDIRKTAPASLWGMK